MRLLRQAWVLARCDLVQEARRLELVATTGFFTVVVLALFGLSFAALRPAAQVVAVPGLLWLTVAFVGALALGRVFDREREADTLRAILVAPADRLAIYVSKALVVLGILLGCCTLLVPGLALLFPGAEGLFAAPVATAGVVALGCVGYVAVGTVFAAGLAGSSGRGLLLAIVLHPLTSPVLLFALVATRAILERHPAVPTYLGQLAALDVVLLVVGALVFEDLLVPRASPRAARRRAQ
jgi:heme exporter protein B